MKYLLIVLLISTATFASYEHGYWNRLSTHGPVVFDLTKQPGVPLIPSFSCDSLRRHIKRGIKEGWVYKDSGADAFIDVVCDKASHRIYINAIKLNK